MSRAITGELSAELPDGTVLTDSTDLGLAWKVAEHTLGDRWATMTYGAKVAEVTDVLAALREAYHGS